MGWAIGHRLNEKTQADGELATLPVTAFQIKPAGAGGKRHRDAANHVVLKSLSALSRELDRFA
ncbi:MAG TPA: hypothetical protein VMU69_10620 [Bradyrhizobium sp.]|nr:hypothetical protein [Bradyrhizobium sp.]